MALDLQGFYPDNTPNQGLKAISQNLERFKEHQYEIDYRNKKDKESEDWRKLNLIDDLTDLSKHQTGSDVADAIAKQKMGEIYQKYTQAASKMSPAELQSNIQKDMSGLISGVDATKQELSLADEQIKQLKTKYPSLDISKLGTDYRKEILSRRLQNNTDFTNPLQVPLSQFDITDPELMSKYVTGNKGLSTAIINPQGAETLKVFTGNPRAYTEYSAKVPFWKKENFDRSKTSDGFYNGHGEPQLEIKASAIPSSALPSSNGKPFMVMDEDVYDRFSQDEGMNLELISATREKYKNYDNFNPQEKELAKRNVLYDKISSLDQSQYYPTDVKAAPITHNRTNINVGTGQTTINDVYGSIEKKVDDPRRPHHAVPLNELDDNEGGVVLKIAREREGNDITQADIYIKKDTDGVIKIYHIDGHVIAPLTKTGTNMRSQPSVKEKREVLSENSNKKPVAPTSTNKWDKYKVQ